MNKYDKILNEATSQLNEVEDTKSITVYQNGMAAIQTVISLINVGDVNSLKRIATIGGQKVVDDIQTEPDTSRY
jgi:hypothetical protein